MRTIWKRFWRWSWPGVVGLVLTFVFLWWWLEARPRFVMMMPLTGPSSVLDHFLSEDGNYLATRRRGIIGGKNGAFGSLIIHDLRRQREVFSTVETFLDYRFDADGSLAYLVRLRNRGAGKADLVQLCRWDPISQASNLVWEHEAKDTDDTRRVIKFDAVMPFTLCRLSPDTRTVLFASVEKDEIQAQLIDGKTGAIRSRFNLTKSETAEMLYPEMDGMFLKDGRTLVMQTQQIQSANRETRWHWIDVKTGEEHYHVVMPKDYRIEMFQVTETTPVAWARHLRKHGRFLATVKDRQSQISEMAFASDSGQITVDDHLSYEVFVDRYFDGQHILFVKDNELLIHDIPHAQQFRRTLSGAEKGCYYAGVLPGTTILCVPEANDRLSLVEKWLHEARNWLGMNRLPTMKVRMIEGRSGQQLEEITLPKGQASAILSQDGKTLTIVSGLEKHMELHEYDYPLRRPWGLIGMWSVGVGLMVLLLAGWRRWRRRTNACN